MYFSDVVVVVVVVHSALLLSEPFHSIHINKYKLNSTLVVTIPTLRVVTNGAPSEECEKEMAHKYFGQ